MIELLTVVVIIGILSAIAVPAYSGYMVDTRRAQAQGLLLELAAFMERYYTETGTYADATLPFTQHPKAGDAIYRFAFFTQEANVFKIRALPQDAQKDADTKCGILGVTSAGGKCIANGHQCSDSAAAWVRAKMAKSGCW